MWTTSSRSRRSTAIFMSFPFIARRCSTAIARIGICRWNPQPLPTATGYPARLQAGYTERYLFLYLEVDDPQFVAEPADVHPERDRFDRVDLTLQTPDGSLEFYFFATGAPGLIEAQTLVKSEGGIDRAAGEPRIQAFWLQTSRGYHLEVRLPLSLVGARLWIEARDAGGDRSAGFAADETLRGGRLFMRTPGLDELLATFIRPGTRATVIDANALKLGVAGTLASSVAEEDTAAAGTWYRRFMTVDTSDWPLQASFPDRAEGKSVTAALAGHPAAEWLRTGGTSGSRAGGGGPDPDRRSNPRRGGARAGRQRAAGAARSGA